MNKTILITGASSGIGKVTAKTFQQNGWNVVATMRSPENESELSQLENVLVTRLDVLDHGSIENAVNEGIAHFGKIDVLLNNAGYGAYGPLEAFSMERIERQFGTNVIGLLATTKAVLKHFRENKSGLVINISSIGGKMTFPFGTLYHGTKFAVEGLSEALHYELEAFGARVKIVEPGIIKTDFGGRSFDFVLDDSMPEYLSTANGMQKVFASFAANPSDPQVVADVVWQAATDGTNQLRYRAGADAEEILNRRNEQDDSTFIEDIKRRMAE